MSIQPVNKAVEHLINSTPVLEREKKREKKAINAYLKNKKNSKVGGGGGGTIIRSQKDWVEFYGCIK